MASFQELSAKIDKMQAAITRVDRQMDVLIHFQSHQEEGVIESKTVEWLTPQSKGLDFGSGPGPTLSVMLEEAGHSVALYDLYYADEPAVLERQYDFITCTEVIEHIAQTRMVLDKLWALLAPGGYLALMTKQVTDQTSFTRWHYKNDLTHISFFSRQAFDYLGASWGVDPLFIGADVIIFRRPTAGLE